MNDLSPQSQPWVREVTASNADTLNKINRVRTNMLTQQNAVNAALTTVAARIPQLQAQTNAMQRVASVANSKDLGTLPDITDNVYFPADYVGATSPGNKPRTVSVFVSTQLIYNLSATQTAIGRLRIGINGVYSPFFPLLTSSGLNSSTNVWATTLTDTIYVSAVIEIMFPNKAAIVQNANNSYRNSARTGLTAVWS